MANLKKRKTDQESAPPLPVSYIPKHSDSEEEASDEEEEDIAKLLEPLSKPQLISLLRAAAVSHPPTLSSIRRLADADPSHRKIFVHGLGWTTTADTLRQSFAQFGPLDDVRVVTDKQTERSKGYGFVLFRHRKHAQKALKQPQKLIDGRMTACQLASLGPPSSSSANPNPTMESNLARKVYVGNVHPDVDAGKLRAFFAQFGEIEEGPVGFDRVTGKAKGFALFVYKTLEGARKALEEPSKNFEGNVLVCQQASENSGKSSKVGNTNPSNPNLQNVKMNQNHNQNLNPNPNPNTNAVVPNVAGAGNAGQGYPGPVSAVGAMPDMTAFLGQGLMQPNPAALIAMLAAAGQNPAAFGMSPAVLASLTPAIAAAAFGGGAQPAVPSASVGGQPAPPGTNQGYGGMGGVSYQQSLGGGFQATAGIQGPPGFPPAFQGSPGFQGPPGFQNGPQGGGGGAYQGGAMQRPPVGQMGGFGLH